MDTDAKYDSWSAGQNYEHYMGRWSRKVAESFLDWLSPEGGLDWLELGCGTGALSSAILAAAQPKSLTVTDFSADFLNHTRGLINDARARFQTADAQALPFAVGSFDVVASALAFNFVPDKPLALAEMRRVLRPGGHVAFYVWDYPGGGMGFIDAFWKAAAALDPQAAGLDEALRFPFCTPDGLRGLFDAAGLDGVLVEALETETEFPDFEAFWRPFTLGAGPAPGYCKTLDAGRLNALKERLRSMVGADGPVRLPARAWAVRAVMAQ